MQFRWIGVKLEGGGCKLRPAGSSIESCYSGNGESENAQTGEEGLHVKSGDTGYDSVTCSGVSSGFPAFC